MTQPPHILLIGNYLPDGEESMDRYALMLVRNLPALGWRVSFLRPPVVAGRLACGSRALAKFFGYIDKLGLFPGQLRRFLAHAARAHPVDLVHLCDNGNAFYVPAVHHAPRPPLVLITCHDFFALNGTLDLQPGVRPRLTGRCLQRYTFGGLRRADHFLCVSDETGKNLLRLPGCAQARSTTIANGLAESFRERPGAAAGELVGALHPALGANPHGYVFHLGNNLWYKNREFVLEAYFELCRRLPAPPPLVLAGKKLEPDLTARVAAAPANATVVDLGRVDDAQLAALYTNAGCLFFPSLAEGFGWPVLEAMACRCPVITSARAPMAEIAGEAAVLVDPTDVGQAADALEKILRLSTEERSETIARGLREVEKFSAERMIKETAQLYRTLLSHEPAGDGPRGREPSSHA